MAKSGFVPAWMKLPSSDKTNATQKLNINRTTHPTLISGRQRHHSSDFYGQTKNSSNEQQKKSDNLFSLNNNPTSKFHLSNNDNRFLTNKDHLFQTKHNEFLNSFKNEIKIKENKISSHSLTKQTIFLLSLPETTEEKEFLKRMGWNDDMTYEITDKDKEEYEKQIKLLPKIENRSARLITALNRRTLPYINIQDILQLENINSISDDESSDE